MMQPANPGDNPWKDWAKEVGETQPDKVLSCSTTWHMPAADIIGTQPTQEGVDHLNGLFRQVRTWLDPTPTLTMKWHN